MGEPGPAAARGKQRLTGNTAWIPGLGKDPGISLDPGILGRNEGREDLAEIPAVTFPASIQGATWDGGRNSKGFGRG